MKIHELAKELDMDAKEVLEKAQSMGIEVNDKDSTLKDIDAKAVKNTVLRGRSGAETKIVKAAPKKKEQTAQKKAKQEEPKVTVKAAKVAIPMQHKAAKSHTAKQQEKTSCRQTSNSKRIGKQTKAAGRQTGCFQRAGGKKQKDRNCRGRSGSG